MRKPLLAIFLLLGSLVSRSEPILLPLDNVVTNPEDCVLDNGTYYFVEGFSYDGLLVTSKVSCDDAFYRWTKIPSTRVKMYKI